MPFSPENTKLKICELLSKSHPKDDVYVSVGPNRYGLFVLDEKLSKHEHIQMAFVTKTLGVKDLKFSEVTFSWSEIS